MENNNYKEFVKNIDIMNIYLSKLESYRFYDNNNLPTNINIDINNELKLDKKEDDGFICKAHFNLIGKHEDTIIFKITAEITVIYRYLNRIETNDEIINEFININLPINVWPYAREIINSLTMRMGLPPLILPTFKVL